ARWWQPSSAADDSSASAASRPGPRFPGSADQLFCGATSLSSRLIHDVRAPRHRDRFDPRSQALQPTRESKRALMNRDEVLLDTNLHRAVIGDGSLVAGRRHKSVKSRGTTVKAKFLSTVGVCLIAATAVMYGAAAQDDNRGDNRGDDHHPHHIHTATPIKHLVVIFNENRSFDHYFATYPN